MSQRSGPIIDKSGSITTGDTAQTISVARSGREYLFIQNVSAGDLWINFGVTAVKDQPSIKIVSNGSMVFEGRYCPTDYVSIIGATTGQKFTCKEG